MNEVADPYDHSQLQFKLQNVITFMQLCAFKQHYACPLCPFLCIQLLQSPHNFLNFSLKSIKILKFLLLKYLIETTCDHKYSQQNRYCFVFVSCIPTIRFYYYHQYMHLLLYYNHIQMQNTGQTYDPRFYYVRVLSLHSHQQNLDFQKNNIAFQLRLQIGSKYSQTTIKPQSLQHGAIKKQDRMTQQAHIFKYGAQQMLNIYLQQKVDKQKKQKKDKRARISGYGRVLLTPIVQLPHAKHTVQVSLIQIGTDLQIKDKIVAKLTLQIHFRMNFKGSMDIIPISANLQFNVAQLGDMKPIVTLEVQKNSWSSLQADGGIHPRWSGHYLAQKDTQGVIRMGNRIQMNRFLSLPQRLQMLAVNSQLGVAARYFDCCQFQLKSAGSYMKIQVLSKPVLGKQPQLVGESQLRLCNAGFLKYPRKESDNRFETKDVTLYRKNQLGENQVVGTMRIQVRFVFDNNCIVDPVQQQIDLMP